MAKNHYLQHGRFSTGYMIFLAVLFLLPVQSHAGAWGDASIGFYPFNSQIVAPNGLVYDPFMRLEINLNIGTKELYIFANNDFFTEKPTPGVTTNLNQGSFDFTKREYDLVIGVAVRPLKDKDLEFRVWLISLANLNRGTSPEKPSGFKDGTAAEARYFFNREKLWGYVYAGYFFSKELVEPDGEPFKPGILFGTNLNYDILTDPKKLYLFGDIKFINTNSHIEGGLAWRPFDVESPNTEIRGTYGHYVNFKEQSISQNMFLLEVKHYFDTF